MNRDVDISTKFHTDGKELKFANDVYEQAVTVPPEDAAIQVTSRGKAILPTKEFVLPTEEPDGFGRGYQKNEDGVPEPTGDLATAEAIMEYDPSSGLYTKFKTQYPCLPSTGETGL